MPIKWFKSIVFLGKLRSVVVSSLFDEIISWLTSFIVVISVSVIIFLVVPIILFPLPHVLFWVWFMESFWFFLDLFLPIYKFFNNFFFEDRFFYYFLNNDWIFVTVHYFLNNCFNWFLHYIGHFDLFDSFNKHRLLWLLELLF